MGATPALLKRFADNAPAHWSTHLMAAAKYKGNQSEWRATIVVAATTTTIIAVVTKATKAILTTRTMTAAMSAINATDMCCSRSLCPSKRVLLITHTHTRAHTNIGLKVHKLSIPVGAAVHSLCLRVDYCFL